MSFYDGAQTYLQLGWPLIPLHVPVPNRAGSVGCSCGNSECTNQGKHPRTKNGFKDASLDPRQIEAWAKIWPDANIGVATGKASGVIVLDIDGAEGKASMGKLFRNNFWLPRTGPMALTGGGGIHLFFKAHSGVKNSVSKVADKVDIRGEGGKIVVAPSVHRSGVVYEWARSPLEHKLPIMPLWVLKHLEKRDAEKQRRQYQADRDAGLKVTKDQARERIDRFALELAGMKADSGRNNTLNRNAFIGFRLARESGLSTHEVEHTFLSAAKACGLDHMSSLKTIKSAERSAFSKP